MTQVCELCMRYVGRAGGYELCIGHVWGRYWVCMGHVSGIHGVCMEYVWDKNVGSEICMGGMYMAYVWEYPMIMQICLRFAIPAEAIRSTEGSNGIIFVPGVRLCFYHGNGNICLIPATHMSRGHIFEKCRNLVPAGT